MLIGAKIISSYKYNSPTGTPSFFSICRRTPQMSSLTCYSPPPLKKTRVWNHKVVEHAHAYVYMYIYISIYYIYIYIYIYTYTHIYMYYIHKHINTYCSSAVSRITTRTTTQSFTPSFQTISRRIMPYIITPTSMSFYSHGDSGGEIKVET